MTPGAAKDPARGRVCVIIVTFQSSKYITECLESLTRQTYRAHDVVLIDNNSSDNTVELARRFGVSIIENGANVGFAAANNQGAALAAERFGSEYLLLLNPDTVASETLIEELVRTLEADESRCIAQAKVFLAGDRELFNTAGNLLHYLYFSYCGSYRKPDTISSDREITVASGACLMLRSGYLESLGYLFNEDFFIYHEDTDLSMRARLMGCRPVLSSNAVVWHDYSFGSGKVKFYHMEKNRLFLMLQNYQASTLALLMPALLFTEAQVLVFALIKGWFLQKVQSYTWLLGNMGRVLEKRRFVQGRRLVSDRELLGCFATGIVFEEVSNPALKYITNPLLGAYFRVVSSVIRAFARG